MLPGTFSEMGLQIAVTQNFPVLSKSGMLLGCQLKPNLMMHVLRHVLYYSLSFNDCLLQVC